jgi:hypothetical protein
MESFFCFFFKFWELTRGIIAQVLKEIPAICGISFGFPKRPPPEHIMGPKNSSKTQYEIIARCTPGFATRSLSYDLSIKYFYPFTIFTTNGTNSEYSLFENIYLKKTANQENELCNISEGLIIFTVERQVLSPYEITRNAATTEYIMYEQLNVV